MHHEICTFLCKFILLSYVLTIPLDKDQSIFPYKTHYLINRYWQHVDIKGRVILVFMLLFRFENKKRGTHWKLQQFINIIKDVYVETDNQNQLWYNSYLKKIPIAKNLYNFAILPRTKLLFIMLFMYVYIAIFKSPVQTNIVNHSS